MTSKRRKRLHALCHEARIDDGRDPRFDLPVTRGSVGNRKALQLCSHIERELNSVLAGCADEVLQSLMVLHVQPAPTSARILIQVTPCLSADNLSLEEIYEHLEQASGMIRSEIASVIHRKRVPEILFQVILSAHA